MDVDSLLQINDEEDDDTQKHSVDDDNRDDVLCISLDLSPDEVPVPIAAGP